MHYKDVKTEHREIRMERQICEVTTLGRIRQYCIRHKLGIALKYVKQVIKVVQLRAKTIIQLQAILTDKSKTTS